MRNIDFIPAWYRDRQAEVRGARWRTTGLCIALFLTAVWTVDGVRRAHAAELTRAQLQATSDAQGALLAALAALDKERTEQARCARILEAIGGDVPAHEVLAEVSHVVPDSLTLQTVRLHREPHWKIEQARASAADGNAPAGARGESRDDAVLELVGWADAGGDVSALVGALDGGPLCADVTLRYQRPVEVAGRSMLEFQVQCTMPRFE